MSPGRLACSDASAASLSTMTSSPYPMVIWLYVSTNSRHSSSSFQGVNVSGRMGPRSASVMRQRIFSCSSELKRAARCRTTAGGHARYQLLIPDEERHGLPRLACELQAIQGGLHAPGPFFNVILALRFPD